MTHPEDDKAMLAALRAAPTEVSLEQVRGMVAAFPLAVGAMAWIISAIKFNLNTVLMTSSATLLVGASAYLLGTSTPADLPALAHTAESTVVMEMPAEPEPEPAVVFEMPAPKKGPAPGSKGDTPAADIDQPELACSPVLTTHHHEEADAMPPDPSEPQALAAATPEPPAGERSRRTGSAQRTFDLRGFTGVAVMGSVSAVLEEGEFSVVADGDQSVLDQLEVSTEGHILKVGFARSRVPFSSNGKVEVRIRMPNVQELLVMGSGSIRSASFSKASELQLKVMGSGGIIFNGLKEVQDLVILLQGSGDVNCQQMNVRGNTTVHVMGSGDAILAGTTDRIDVTVQGSGDVHATNMRSRNGGRVSVVGSGDASVYSDGPLELLTTGSGTIHTSGSAGTNRSRGVGDNGR